MEVFDSSGDGQGLIVGPVVVLGIDRSLPHVPDGPVQGHHFVVVFPEMEK